MQIQYNTDIMIQASGPHALLVSSLHYITLRAAEEEVHRGGQKRTGGAQTRLAQCVPRDTRVRRRRVSPN